MSWYGSKTELDLYQWSKKKFTSLLKLNHLQILKSSKHNFHTLSFNAPFWSYYKRFSERLPVFTKPFEVSHILQYKNVIIITLFHSKQNTLDTNSHITFWKNWILLWGRTNRKNTKFFQKCFLDIIRVTKNFFHNEYWPIILYVSILIVIANSC